MIHRNWFLIQKLSSFHHLMPPFFFCSLFCLYLIWMEEEKNIHFFSIIRETRERRNAFKSAAFSLLILAETWENFFLNFLKEWCYCCETKIAKKKRKKHTLSRVGKKTTKFRENVGAEVYIGLHINIPRTRC